MLLLDSFGSFGSFGSVGSVGGVGSFGSFGSVARSTGATVAAQAVPLGRSIREHDICAYFLIAVQEDASVFHDVLLARTVYLHGAGAVAVLQRQRGRTGVMQLEGRIVDVQQMRCVRQRPRRGDVDDGACVLGSSSHSSLRLAHAEHVCAHVRVEFKVERLALDRAVACQRATGAAWQQRRGSAAVRACREMPRVRCCGRGCGCGVACCGFACCGRRGRRRRWRTGTCDRRRGLLKGSTHRRTCRPRVQSGAGLTLRDGPRAQKERWRAGIRQLPASLACRCGEVEHDHAAARC